MREKCNFSHHTLSSSFQNLRISQQHFTAKNRLTGGAGGDTSVKKDHAGEPMLPEYSTSDRDHSITLSKSNPFTLAGFVLFGPRWKAPLARTLGVTRETVSKWVSSGDIPKWASNTVALLSARKGSVLSLCDRTGIMVKPWAAVGFECFCVDIRHQKGEQGRDDITYIGADIREWLPPARRYAIVFAFPPCSNLATSGRAWFKQKGLAGLTEGIELVETCRRIAEWSRAPWMIENPVSTLASYWRKPDYTFHPFEFGGWPSGENDDYRKHTCLWIGGGFRLPQKRPIPMRRPLYINNMPETDERRDLRSITPPGFAQAVFEANVGRFGPYAS